jgi:hypothetical protein
MSKSEMQGGMGRAGSAVSCAQAGARRNTTGIGEDTRADVGWRTGWRGGGYGEGRGRGSLRVPVQPQGRNAAVRDGCADAETRGASTGEGKMRRASQRTGEGVRRVCGGRLGACADRERATRAGTVGHGGHECGGDVEAERDRRAHERNSTSTWDRTEPRGGASAGYDTRGSGAPPH